MIYSDAHVIVIDKPAGLLSVPGRGEERADCAAQRVLGLAPDALIVHRLDMSTSGLLLFARGPDMQRWFSMCFMNRQVDKSYVAVVHGQLHGDKGSVDLPLITDWPNRPRQKVDHEIGKPALTHWEVIGRDERQTRVALTPITGRSHQLRVHMASLGHPIMGDELYGPVPPLSDRLHLHATMLSLQHPISQATMVWTSTPPF